MVHGEQDTFPRPPAPKNTHRGRVGGVAIAIALHIYIYAAEVEVVKRLAVGNRWSIILQDK